ncbi:hypothetical protein Hte_000338 [Hypoxylon texense]
MSANASPTLSKADVAESTTPAETPLPQELLYHPPTLARERLDTWRPILILPVGDSEEGAEKSDPSVSSEEAKEPPSEEEVPKEPLQKKFKVEEHSWVIDLHVCISPKSLIDMARGFRKGYEPEAAIMGVRYIAEQILQDFNLVIKRVIHAGSLMVSNMMEHRDCVKLTEDDKDEIKKSVEEASLADLEACIKELGIMLQIVNEKYVAEYRKNQDDLLLSSGSDEYFDDRSPSDFDDSSSGDIYDILSSDEDIEAEMREYEKIEKMYGEHEEHEEHEERDEA